jgi:transposase InsO family protein
MEKRRIEAKHFSEEQIREFQNNPYVRYVDDHTIRFTFEFRVILYEAWKKEKRQGVRRTLTEYGFDLKVLTRNVIGSLCKTFKKNGRPKNAFQNNPVGSRAAYRTNPEDDECLLKTGKFVRGRNGKGVTFRESFKNELFSAYPEQSIVEGLRKAGIDPNHVGYHRIYTLQRLFNGDASTPEPTHYSEEIRAKYKDHPYINAITAKMARFSYAFYNEASFLIEIMKIDEILEMYELDPADFSISARLNLKHRLRYWKRTDARFRGTSPQLVRIQHRRWQKLTELMEERFRRIREEELPAMNHIEKKKLCYWIQGFPLDPMKIVNTGYLLKKVGISRSAYYSILRNNKYGVAGKRREEQDAKDIEVIRLVMAYRGFHKGSRQIFMTMKEVTGYQFSLKKIKRLMKKFGVRSGIREKKHSRIEARKALEEHKKPNLLKRRFRIGRPNTHVLTDVTYIPYGFGKLAYGSAAYDAVTGRLYDLTISECNDMALVSATVDELRNITFRAGAIFHSDQGSLYLTDTYQNQIRDLGLRQSMSKRGNCCDNAPMESFFGHFKDECDYRSCTSITELQTLCDIYRDYYNTERRQWSRNRMTPMEYEKYLSQMNEPQFEEYIRIEKKKYRQMKKKAAERAVERAKTLGV